MQGQTEPDTGVFVTLAEVEQLHGELVKARRKRDAFERALAEAEAEVRTANRAYQHKRRQLGKHKRLTSRALDSAHQTALALLRAYGGMPLTIRDVMEETNLSYEQARYALDRLVYLSLVETKEGVGIGGGRPQKLFYVPTEEDEHV